MRAARVCLACHGRALASPRSVSASRSRPQITESQRHYIQPLSRINLQNADTKSSTLGWGARRFSDRALADVDAAEGASSDPPPWSPLSGAKETIRDSTTHALPEQRTNHETAQEVAVAAQDQSPSIHQTSRFSSKSPRKTAAPRNGGRQDKPFSPEKWENTKTNRENFLHWSYIRHQYSEDTRPMAKTAFKAWKANLVRVRRGNEPLLTLPSSEEGFENIQKLENVSSINEAWRALDADVRSRHWPALMLATLHFHPEKATVVLDATLDPSIPGYAIHDVLLFSARHLQPAAMRNARQRTTAAEQVLELLSRTMFTLPKGHVPFTQRIFGLYAKKMPENQAYELYQMVQRAGIKLHPNTVIQFASRLSKSAEHKTTAFAMLKGLVEDGIDLNEARPSSVITSLLHCKVSQSTALHEQSTPDFSPKEALHYFIEKGFTLNVITATAFLDSLCQGGEVEEAIRLALLFAESDVRLDKKAWATVFRGAKGSLKVENVARALDVAKVADVAYSDVLSNALHAAFFFAEAEKREKRRGVGNSGTLLFDTLLRIYAKKFDLEPLQWWLPDSLPLRLAQAADDQGAGKDWALQQGSLEYEETIVPFVDKLFVAGDDAKLPPSLTGIATMMRAYIRSLKEPYELVSFYDFFKSRLHEQSKDETIPSAWRLVKNQGSLIHDTIILSMTEHSSLSRSALEVFGDMLRDQRRVSGQSTPAGAQGSAVLRPIRESAWDATDGVRGNGVHPAPTILTFTILLRGLNRNRDRVLADQVVQIMREQEMEPNLTTWNTLIHGHASMQDVCKTVSTLQDMEAGGARPDDYTFKAFGRLRDQNRALAMMERMIDNTQSRIAAQEQLH